MIFKRSLYSSFYFYKIVDKRYFLLYNKYRNKERGLKTMTIIKNLLLMFIIVFGWIIFPILAHFVVEDWVVAIFWGELAYLVFFLVQTALVGNQEYRIYK